LLKGDHCRAFHSLKEVQERPVREYPVELCHVADKDPFSCGIFCYWQEDAGIIQVPKASWEKVSNIEYSIWKFQEKVVPDDRNSEHAEGLGAFAALPSDLGNYLEIGAGPYTQTNNILNVRKDVHIKNIYLAEPNIFRYLSLGNCVYKNGTIHGQRVNLLSLPVEELPATEFFDTVVAINVIEHVFSAIDFLTAMYSALKPGGVLVFGERYFEDPDKDALVLGSAVLHPIRVKRIFLQHFLRLFDVLYIGDHHTSFAKARGLGESGYYFIGRKKKTFSASDEPAQAELDLRFPANPFEAWY
jgi:SAM-dependent methyltransferase